MIDWATLGEETVENLRRYLMVDTTNPPGNEAAGGVPCWSCWRGRASPPPSRNPHRDGPT